MPIHPHVFFELPGSFNMLIHILIYAAGTALTALGGFHGYRYCGGRSTRCTTKIGSGWTAMKRISGRLAVIPSRTRYRPRLIGE